MPDYALRRIARLESALRLVLSFHSAGPWTYEDSQNWHDLTGNDNATTKSMCDHIRAVLDEEVE